MKIISTRIILKKKDIEMLKYLQRLKNEKEVDRDENNNDHKINIILRINFDNLKVERKNMFLDI